MNFECIWSLIEKIISIATLFAGFGTMLAAIAAFRSINQSIKTYNSQMALTFFTEVEEERFIEIRKKLYNSINLDDVSSQEKAYVINFFHKWGEMAKLGYLSLEVFNSSSGYAMIRLYKILEEEIEKNKEESKNEQYADSFKWLYNEVKTKYFEKANNSSS